MKSATHMTKRGASSSSRDDLRVKWEHELILGARPIARKMGMRFLHRWGARIEMDELESLADLALVEAAKCFNPTRGANFVTYLYFFLRGYLIREMTHRHHGEFLCGEGVDLERLSAHEQEGALFSEGAALHSYEESPEHEMYVHEIREACHEALAALSELERTVVMEVHVQEVKVAALARRLGYSRGHLSEVRRHAFSMLRENLEEFRTAA